MADRIRIMKEADEPKEPVNITALYIDFCQKYRNVYIVELDGQNYIYRALGRGEYREILADNRFNDYQKEEIICSQCLLYPDPETIVWDDLPAGIPTELQKIILRESFLDSTERRRKLHDYYRAEMYDIDNQITCIISEAFPNLDIEEIEKWDVEKTTKYLSRAEWKLHALHNMEFDIAEDGQNSYSRENAVPMEPRPDQEKVQKNKQKTKTHRGGERTAKLTPEKMKEREEFLKMFPQFANDSVESEGIEGMAQEGVDCVSPALRVGM